MTSLKQNGGLNHSWFVIGAADNVYFSIWVEIDANHSYNQIIAGLNVLLSSLLLAEFILIGTLLILDRKLLTVTNFFIFSCAFIATLMLPFSIILYIVAAEGHWSVGQYACKFTGFSVISTFGFLMWTMAAIAVDRHRQITAPSKGQLKIKSACGITVLTAFTSVLLGIPYIILYEEVRVNCQHDTNCYICGRASSVVGSAYTVTAIILSFLVPLAVVCFCYRGIYLHFKRSHRRIEAHAHGVNTSVHIITSNQGQPLQPDTVLTTHEKRMRKYQRIVKTLIIIVTTYVVMWLPLISLFGCITIDQEMKNYRLKSFHILAGVAGFILNTCITPLLYSLSDRNMKEAVFSRCKRCVTNAIGDSI